MMHPVPWPKMRRPLIASLRGLPPEVAGDIGHALVDAGFEAIEVPVNTPHAMHALEALADDLPDDILLAAGAVLSESKVLAAHDLGIDMILAPNVDPAIIAVAASRAMASLPGAFTPTEALRGVAAGASALNFFPAGSLGPVGVAAVRAVLPPGVVTAAAGALTEDDFAAYRAAGIDVFVIGARLYQQGATAREVEARARAVIAAWDALG